MNKNKVFKEFLVCPECEMPIVSKEEIVSDTRFEKSKYCRKCGKEIASTYKDALAIVTKSV